MPDHAPAPELRHLILSLARPSAYVPLSRAVLARMGYAIVPVEEWAESPLLQARRPACCIVDEKRLAELPADRELDHAPIILLTGREGAAPTRDKRILGAIAPPAGLHELYRLLQQALEEHPRGCLRVPTNLPARLSRGDERQWTGAVLSLSESGCLLRTAEPMPLGAQVEIAFDLPSVGRIETSAEAAYQLLPDLGLVFQRTPAASRKAILAFVERQLAA